MQVRDALQVNNHKVTRWIYTSTHRQQILQFSRAVLISFFFCGSLEQQPVGAGRRSGVVPPLCGC